MPTDLDDRVRALERALTERDDPAGPIPDIAAVDATANDLDDRVSDLESRMADLTARQQAVEAYVDRVEHVNESIERRADAALAAVDRLETSMEHSHAPASAEGSRPSTDGRGEQQMRGRGEQQSTATGGDSQASHVTDAAKVETGQDDDADSRGLMARLVSL